MKHWYLYIQRNGFEKEMEEEEDYKNIRRRRRRKGSREVRGGLVGRV